MKIICKDKKELFELLDATRIIHDNRELAEAQNEMIDDISHIYTISFHSGKDDILDEIENDYLSVEGISLKDAIKEYVER